MRSGLLGSAAFFVQGIINESTYGPTILGTLHVFAGRSGFCVL